MGNSSIACMLALLIAGVCKADTGANTYYGRLIGSLESQYHGIRGDVYAVDARTLFIKGFSYDGKGQDALFYAGSSSRVGTDGFVIPNEDGSTESLSRAYEDQDLTLTLPEGKTIKEIRWLTVWSRSFSEAFGEVKVPAGFDYPRPQRLTPLSGIHQVASDRIYVVDAQTFLLPNFTYDGQAPDAFFWVGTGPKPNQEGAQVPDENGKTEPLRRYDTKTLVLTLPGDLTVFDVEWLSVWCKAYGIDFGHIRIPKNLNVPPSLKMLGVAPQPDDDIYNKVLIGDGNKPRTAPLARRRAPQYTNQPQPQQNARPPQQRDTRRPVGPAPTKVVAPANRLQSFPAFYSRSVPVRHFNRAV